MKEGPHPGGLTSVPIATTYLSCDLFQPFREPRSTLPGIGVFLRPSCPAHWGTTHSEYGGTGEVGSTRGHNHFGSGVSTTHAFPLPNRIRFPKRIPEDYIPPPQPTREEARDIDKKEQKEKTKHQERRTCSIPAIRLLREHKLQSTLKHEQIPTSDFDSSTENEDKSEPRKGCCKRCGANILQTADTNNSADESSDNSEGSGNDAQEDANSFRKWCPCVRYGSHSHGKDLLTQRRQQMQQPQRKSLYHKHTVLQACFTLPWKQSAAGGAASNPDWQSHVNRADTPVRTLHPLSDSLPRNLHQGSLNPANLRLVQSTANSTVPLSNTAIPRRMGEHLTAEDTTALGFNTTAADVRGLSSLPPISCFTQRKYQANHFEKKLPLYLALHRPSPQ